MAAATDFILFPLAVIVDSREQLPFSFGGLRADGAVYGPARKTAGATLIVELCRGTLSAGDYSLAGYESRVTVERKSIADLFNTLGQGRERFVRELARLNDTFDHAAVVVEADWSTILHAPPRFTELRPKTVMRSVIAWQQQFPGIHWWFLPDRRHAEITTFRILERFWRNEQAKKRRDIGNADDVQLTVAGTVKEPT